MAEEKKIVSHSFVDGMNSTIAAEKLPNTAARKMYNCHVLSQGEGSVGVITNIKGNVLITNTLPPGQNECIGSVNQEERSRFIYFIWNSLGYHSIYQFNSISRSVTLIMQSITDTGGIDILNFSNLKHYRINMADINLDNLYWVDGGRNVARNLNIPMALDKGNTGYGPVILAEYINAYKQAPVQAPSAVYFSDTNIAVNRLYGALRKFTYRFVYKSGEKSDYSEYSNVPLPQKESFTGVNIIPTDNNRLDISIETGNREVKLIEIVMQTTLTTGNSSWLLIDVLDKNKLSIPNNSIYILNFYNDGNYGAVDQEKVIRPYTFLPDKPKAQALVRGAMIYGNFKQGFGSVPLNVIHSVRYDPFVIDTGVITKFNNPQIVAFRIPGSDIFLNRGGNVTYNDGRTDSNPFFRISAFTITVGVDVKPGNTFLLQMFTGPPTLPDNVVTVSYTAIANDTTSQVVVQLKNQLIASNRVFKVASGGGLDINIYNNTVNSDGSIAFSFNIGTFNPAPYYNTPTPTVNPVSYETLNDTGQSLSNSKLGDTRQWGFIYTDGDGRTSLTYTDATLVIPIKPINDLGNYKTPVIRFEIYHQPPLWAKYWQLAVSSSLVYDTFIQMLIQKVVNIPSTGAGEYLDLVVGSLYTYQRIHTATTLAYRFEAGDRLRLIRDSDGNYYPFFETEILNYQDTVTDVVNENVTVSGSDQIAVKLASATNIGKFIVVDGNEREIISVASPTSYTVNAPIGSSTANTFLSYLLIDRRGTVRIRKPVIPIKDNSMVEIYKPASKENGVGAKKFFQLSPKYDVLYPGDPVARAHAAPFFNQEVAVGQPGIIELSHGTIYIRNREEPITNNYPGALTKIQLVEDPSYSDFYQSLIDDLGRINVEDNGDGEVTFGSRLRFSNNFIEDTKINGLNDFDNLDRKDYNDQYGDIVLLKYMDNSLLIFKELRDCWAPVYAKLIQDKDGQTILGTSTDLLGDINNFAWEGGIGNNPESYASNGTMKYHVSVNSGVLCRIGGDGVTPISEIYGFDNEVRDLLKLANRNGSKIIGGFDRKNGEYIIHITATSMNPFTTLSFNEKEKKFITYYEYDPELMVKYNNEFFAFNGGRLWEQNVNPIRNNFFGIQRSTRVVFICNIDYEKDKLFFNFRLDGNGKWYCPNMTTQISNQFPSGMNSRLKKNNFKLKDGKLWADILRDITDPSFKSIADINQRALTALMNGRKMQGGYLVCEFQNDDTTEARLASVEVYYTEVERSL